MSRNENLEEKIGKEYQLTKEEFFVKLFDYDADGKLSNYFSSQSRFYETKNITLDFYYKLQPENKILFYVKPRTKTPIGYKNKEKRKK